MPPIVTACAAVLMTLHIMPPNTPTFNGDVAILDMDGKWSVPQWELLDQYFNSKYETDDETVCVVRELIKQRSTLLVVKTANMQCPADYAIVEQRVSAADPIVQKCHSHPDCLTGQTCS